MLRFLVRRLAWSLVVLWFVLSAAFVILHLIPADPVRVLVGPHADPETILRIRHERKLDRPFHEQYLAYMGRLLRGDLDQSYRTRQAVSDLVLDRLGPTVQLTLVAMGLQLVLGIGLGVWAAIRHNRPADFLAQVIALLGQSAPTFLIGPLFMWLLAYRMEWFPISGYGEGGIDRLRHIFLPALTLAVTGTAYYTRLVRGEMIEVLKEDYVRTARAKGLSPTAVTIRHGLRNALSPVVTLVGLDLGVLLGGAVVTEYIFAWPGLGREAVTGILNLDLPLILGVVLVSAVAILVANLLVDVLYAVLDPRVRLE